MPLSDTIKEAVYSVQAKLAKAFGEDAFWFPRDEQLHVTLAHIISPDGTYGQSIPEIYRQIKDEASAAFAAAIAGQTAPAVCFNLVKSFPTAIILQGHDNGTIQSIRDIFITYLTLPDGTRKPPDIIHITLARFLKPLELAKVEKFIAEKCSLNISAELVEVQLVSERKIFLQDFITIENYILPSAKRLA